MAKYMLINCSSVQIGGVVYRSRDKIVFDTEDPKFSKITEEIEAAAKADYIQEVKDEDIKKLGGKKPPKASPKKTSEKATK